jgi:ferritin-like metal-binding protein YciE
MSSHDKTMKARSETLQQYVSDMMAVEEHIGSAVKRQAEDKEVAKHHPKAARIVQDIARLTEQHEHELQRHLEAIGGDSAGGIKEAATAAMGTIAGLYDKIRSEKVSKMLRDDYTALNLATVSYTMLHTTGLAAQDQATASLALRHLKDYVPIIMDLNEVIPAVVVSELKEDGVPVNEMGAQQAMRNSEEAWRSPGQQQDGNGHGGYGSRTV